MEHLLQELEKTVQDFNNINQIKGFNAKYSIWDRTSTKVLCLVIVTRLSDKVTREKYILLDTNISYLTLNWTFAMRLHISSMIL